MHVSEYLRNPPRVEMANINTESKKKSLDLPLHHYTFKNDIDAVKKLLSTGKVSLSARDLRGKTALLVATCFSRVEIARMLLAMGADPNLTDKDGNTPLHEATEKSCLPMVQLLLKTGRCKVDAKNHDGQTPLMKAAYFDYLDILQCLHQKGANLDVKDSKGRTALFYAVGEGSDSAASCLMKSGCDVNLVDTEGHSVLYTAIHSQFFRSSECLLLLEKTGYDFKKDSVWLEKEERSSKFYKQDEVYIRFLKNAGISRKSKDSPVLSRSNRDPWLIPYTFVLGSNNHLVSPRPPRANIRNIPQKAV